MPQFWLHNKIAVELEELVPEFWSSYESLKHEIWRYRKNEHFGIKRLQGGGNGRRMLIDYDTLPFDIKNALGDIRKSDHFMEQFYKVKTATIEFYQTFERENGDSLKIDEQNRYVVNATVLQAVIALENARINERSSKNGKTTGLAKGLLTDLESFNETLRVKYKVQHNLPKEIRRFKALLKRFKEEDLVSVIKDAKGKGKQNARKVTQKIESLIISLYCLPNKPHIESVHDMYLQFLGGGIDVVNIKTGEMFDRKEFFKNDNPIEVSVATVWNYLKAPKNELVIKKARNGTYDFNHKNRPHVNRTAPVYSMSKITLDDRDIMHTKLPDGSKVMAYYAFDDMSGAMIGIAHSKSKNHELYIDCIRSMFRFTTSKGMGIPMQMEVEQHLVSDFKDGLMQAGNVFPFVRWCNPTNSQEKYAERLIGTKKYGVEKDNNQNVGRHYSKRDSNRVVLQKIFDEKNDNYKEAKASFEQIVANELQEQIQYNNELHPNKDKYKGMTRLEVFLQNVNPDLLKLDKALLAKYIGNRTDTSIRRSQYVTVQYAKYQLESPQVLRKLAPNNYDVEAYYIPNESNEVSEVYLYQNGMFITQCKPVPTFNRANSEWTETDKQGYLDATKYISQFDKMVKEDSKNVLEKVTIFKTNHSFIDVTPETVTDIEHEEIFELEYADTQTERSRAINDL
jgi:hypothetical protein